MGRNEAAERLRLAFLGAEVDWQDKTPVQTLDEALATERRLTVERLLAIDPNRLAVCGQDGLAAWVPDARSILDDLATADVDEEPRSERLRAV